MVKRRRGVVVEHGEAAAKAEVGGRMAVVEALETWRSRLNLNIVVAFAVVAAVVARNPGSAIVLLKRLGTCVSLM